MAQEQVIYQEGGYVETIEQEANGVKLVACSENGESQMYRVEWEECGHYQHSAFLDYTIAENNFVNRSTAA